MTFEKTAARHASAGPPAFCPRCNGEDRGPNGLCRDCGETIVPQGYCPVCERYWHLQPGRDCPKHELPLEDTPPAEKFPIPADERSHWVTVATFPSPHAAEARRIRLEAEGIPTFLDGERMGGHSMYQVATGGVKLQVPEPLAADARVILDQQWQSAPTSDWDDAWEELAPEPGSRRRSIMRVAIILFFAMPVLTALVIALTEWLLAE